MGKGGRGDPVLMESAEERLALIAHEATKRFTSDCLQCVGEYHLYIGSGPLSSMLAGWSFLSRRADSDPDKREDAF